MTCYEYVLTAGEQQRQCLIWDVHGHLLSVKTTGRQAGGDGGVEQGELSVDLCVNVTAGWKEATDTQSGAVSCMDDCRIRAG